MNLRYRRVRDAQTTRAAPSVTSTLVLSVLAAGLVATTSCDSARGSGEPAAASPADPQAALRAAPTPRTSRWPRARNTGAHGTLRVIQGRTINNDGAVLRNVRVNGQITIKADDVTLDNVYVKTDSYYGVLVWGRRARILHTTIEGTPGDTLAGLAVYPPGTATARRLNVFGSEDGVRLANRSVLARSFVHGLRGTSESHFDAVTADGYRRWRIVGNRILNSHQQTAAVWVGDPRYGPSSGVLRNNLMAGGGYTIYGGPGTGAGIRVVDNHFSTKYFRRSGYWGPNAYWQRAHNTWSNNRWLDGPQQGRLVRP
jgi:hypothetical protein